MKKSKGLIIGVSTLALALLCGGTYFILNNGNDTKIAFVTDEETTEQTSFIEPTTTIDEKYKKENESNTKLSETNTETTTQTVTEKQTETTTITTQATTKTVVEQTTKAPVKEPTTQATTKDVTTQITTKKVVETTQATTKEPVTETTTKAPVNNGGGSTSSDEAFWNEAESILGGTIDTGVIGGAEEFGSSQHSGNIIGQ